MAEIYVVLAGMMLLLFWFSWIWSSFHTMSWKVKYSALIVMFLLLVYLSVTDEMFAKPQKVIGQQQQLIQKWKEKYEEEANENKVNNKWKEKYHAELEAQERFFQRYPRLIKYFMKGVEL